MAAVLLVVEITETLSEPLIPGDALLAAGVARAHLRRPASGRSDARPGLAGCLKALQPGNTLVIGSWIGSAATCATSSIRSRTLRVRGIGLKVLAGAGAVLLVTARDVGMSLIAANSAWLPEIGSEILG